MGRVARDQPELRRGGYDQPAAGERVRRLSSDAAQRVSRDAQGPQARKMVDRDLSQHERSNLQLDCASGGERRFRLAENRIPASVHEGDVQSNLESAWDR